jgi:hypothetical protein
MLRVVAPKIRAVAALPRQATVFQQKRGMAGGGGCCCRVSSSAAYACFRRYAYHRFMLLQMRMTPCT